MGRVDDDHSLRGAIEIHITYCHIGTIDENDLTASRSHGHIGPVLEVEDRKTVHHIRFVNGVGIVIVHLITCKIESPPAQGIARKGGILAISDRNVISKIITRVIDDHGPVGVFDSDPVRIIVANIVENKIVPAETG